jgi:HK97 family phage portal protein
MTPATLTDLMGRGASRIRASVTLDNINLSNSIGGNSRRPGQASIALVGNKHATYEALYRTQPWIRASVDRVTNGIGRLPWASFVDAEQEGERSRQRTGPLAELLESPFERGTATHLKQAIVKNLMLHENMIAVKVRPGIGRPPSELLPSSFMFWEIIPGETRRIDWYVFHGEIAGKPARIPFRPEEVVHFHNWGTGRGLYGDARMEALRTTLIQEDAAQRAIIAGFENGLRFSGAYSIDGTYKDKATRDRVLEQLREVYGSVDQMFKVMLLEGGAKWQEMSSNFVDADLVNLRKMDREEVAAVMNVPQPSIGILDHATYSNITEQHLMESQDTWQPWTTLIEETLQEHLVKPEPTMRGQYVEFNYKETLKGDPNKEIEAGVKAVGGPYMTVNEFRATQNMSPIEGGDKLYAPSNTPGQQPPQGQA